MSIKKKLVTIFAAATLGSAAADRAAAQTTSPLLATPVAAAWKMMPGDKQTAALTSLTTAFPAFKGGAVSVERQGESLEVFVEAKGNPDLVATLHGVDRNRDKILQEDEIVDILINDSNKRMIYVKEEFADGKRRYAVSNVTPQENSAAPYVVVASNDTPDLKTGLAAAQKMWAAKPAGRP